MNKTSRRKGYGGVALHALKLHRDRGKSPLMIAIFQGAGSEELLRHVSDRVVSQIGFAPEGLAVVGGVRQVLTSMRCPSPNSARTECFVEGPERALSHDVPVTHMSA